MKSLIMQMSPSDVRMQLSHGRYEVDRIYYKL
jgi:hypothetical protein